MIDRLDEILGDCSEQDLAAEPDHLEQHWLDKVRQLVCILGIHAWSDHMVAGGLHEGRSVKECSATVSKAIEEVI